MSDPTGLATYVLEQLADLRGLSSGRFFSGVGFAYDGVQFGMIIQGTLYFVVDDGTRPKYLQRGSRCFAFDKRDRRVESKRYYSVPADVIDDAEELTAMARESIAIALASRKPSAAKRKPSVKTRSGAAKKVTAKARKSRRSRG
jgi:DNA transformation protein